VDVRLSQEQRALQDAAARLVADLGPRTVADLDDAERRSKLDAALAATGWRELRNDASTVEAAIVAEELARGLADVSFIGPVLQLVAQPGAIRAIARPVRDMAADLTGAFAGIPADADIAVGLALTCADLVGVMRGAIDLSTAYARDRKQYGAAIGSFQAVQHLLADAFVAMEGSRSVALHAAWAVDALPPADALAAAAIAKAYCARAARSVCETAIQVHGGIGNTWDCLAHVYLRRALTAIDLFGGVGPNLDRVLTDFLRISPTPHGKPAESREGSVDFSDSPDEAAFRARLRDWLRDNNPGLPASSTSDAYWAGQASWHHALFDAGFFGLSWPKAIGGHELPSVYDVILDEELATAGTPPRPSLGYLVQGILEHGNADIQARFLPGIVSGQERWCQGFSEPDAGSDLAALRTRAERDGDDFVITGHKVWTSYSDVADWCLVLARTDAAVPKHKGLSAFVVAMDQPGIEQRPLKMINGMTKEFGEVIFDGARVPASHMIGDPGDGWRLAMTVVSHEREPGELGYVARYKKTAHELTESVRANPAAYGAEQSRDLAWAIVEAEMLRLHVCRRLSDRLDGITHGPEGSVDKLLMTQVEQAVGHAALSIGGDEASLSTYLYSRAQSVMGGTSQIQRNLVATRILKLPTK